MQGKKDLVKSQKKFRHFKDENSIYLLETFDHNGKTHYVLSSSSYLYIGYMEKAAFNQIINYKLETWATSFCVFQDTLYFGMKDGSVVFISLEKAYNQIPFKRVESVDGVGVMGISVSDKGYAKVLYAICEDSSVKVYTQAEEEFKLSKSVKIDTQIQKIVSKSSSPDQKLPCLMVHPKTSVTFPLLLTLEEIDKLLDKTTDYQTLEKLRENVYLEDQKLYARLTSMDFDTSKMIVALGYNDGSVEVLKIQKSTNGEAFYYMTKELRVQQRENIVCVTIISQPESPYIAFVNESNFSGFNYEKRSSPFAKVKVEKDKDITAIRWTKNRYFLAAPLSTEDKKRAPKLYCIEQDVADEA